jgi:PilZ domain-containing protein
MARGLLSLPAGSAMKGHSTPRKNRNDRRNGTRFAMVLPVRYCFAGAMGWGQILNISSTGAWLSISHPAVCGDLVELYIGWPVLLNDSVHLNLVAKGAIVRVAHGRVAVKFERCDLRTSSSLFLQYAISLELRPADDLAPA